MEDSLNNLRLDTQLLSALYKHSIFEIEEKENLQVAINKEGVPSFRYLGNNLKKVTILVNNPEQTFMPDDQLAFLTRMLTACQMNLGDVAIVNRSMLSSADNYLSDLKPAFILSFEGLDLPNAFKVEVQNGIRYLYAPTLSEFAKETEESRLLKSKLWVMLKEIFNLNKP